MSEPSDVGGVLGWVDDLQRKRPVLGFPYAVFKRYYEDHGGWLGSLISYYGFFSLYPLLVVFTTVATWMLRDRPKALRNVLQAVWSKVPFATPEITSEVQKQVTELSNEGWAVAGVSLIVALWGGVGVVRVLSAPGAASACSIRVPTGTSAGGSASPARKNRDRARSRNPVTRCPPMRTSPDATLGNHSRCCASVPLACSAIGTMARLAEKALGAA